jgi:hypothetical protein
MLRLPRRFLLCLGLTVLLGFALLPAHQSRSLAGDIPVVPGTPAVELEPQVLVDWIQLLYDRVETELISAPAAARLYAYAGITGYEAVRSGIADAFSMAGQLNLMPEMPYPDLELEYDWIASANGAMSTVIAGLFPDSPDTLKAVSALRERYIKSRAQKVAADTLERSTAFGDSIGAAIMEWVAMDNFAETRDMPYDPPSGDPSLWVLTSPDLEPVEPYWGQIRPFALYYADGCAVPMKLAFSTDPDSTFYKQALEVKTIGDNLTPEQKDIARYWVDTPGETGTPAGHWMLIAAQLADQLDLKLDMTSMMFGLVGTAVGDAFISAWSLKYQINLLRPETYIQDYIDSDWRPFIASPGFPEYPSGHSVVSGAATEVLTGMFGTEAFTDRSGRKHGFRERSFTSFYAAAYEASISRIYGGIHYREAIEGGLEQGRCIGRNVLDYVTLRSKPQGE